MIKSKFKAKDMAYRLSFNDLITTSVFAKAKIVLIEIHVTEVKGRTVKGFHFENYGHIMDNYPHKERSIFTKKNKLKGKDIPWKKSDNVALTVEYNERDLYTLEEAKMEMIKYIANDFNDSDSVCIGCTCHQDESY